jgi:hypothetical protein
MREARVMKNENKKAAITAYKKRRAIAGVYAVRCAPTRQS